MKNFLKRYFLAHKVVSIIVILILLIGGYYTVRALTGTNDETQYVLAEAKKGAVTVTVEGTGRVTADNQIELKTKSGGEVVYVARVTGAVVPAGTLIVQVDSRDEALALEDARLKLQKLIKPAAASDLAQAKNDLAKANVDGLNAVVAAFVDLPIILDDLENFLDQVISGEVARLSGVRAEDFRAAAVKNFYQAKNSQKKAAAIFKTTTVTSDQSVIQSLVASTYGAVQDLAQALKDAKTTYDFIQKDRDWPTRNSDRDNLTDWIDTTARHLTALLSARNAIQETSDNLADLIKGADDLDVQSAKLDILAKQNAYDDTFVRAPFAGQIARLDVQRGETVSSGALVGIFITRQKIAEINLNEVDATNVRIGQKATLTFDAVPDLAIEGQVVEIDLVGTENQGVVNYGVKIGFDAQDKRIKAGMSANAEIVLATKTDVLTIPTVAVKTQNGRSYVQIFTSSSTPPRRQNVVTGLEGKGRAEIVSGLRMGEKVVTRSVHASNSSEQAPSIFGSFRSR